MRGNAMQIENHKEEVPFAHYEALFREMDPMEAAQRTRTPASCWAVRSARGPVWSVTRSRVSS